MSCAWGGSTGEAASRSAVNPASAITLAKLAWPGLGRSAARSFSSTSSRLRTVEPYGPTDTHPDRRPGGERPTRARLERIGDHESVQGRELGGLEGQLPVWGALCVG